GGVSAVACTVLDGRTVAVIGSTDGTVRIWDLVGGACAVVAVGLEVHAVAATPDGALVLGLDAEVMVMDQGKELNG
ncbi:hypothetical protein ACFXKC_10780, partial [Streptomyces sp. NPDC059340]